MNDKEDKEDCIASIVQALPATAAWRTKLTQRYPEDSQNAKAAATTEGSPPISKNAVSAKLVVPVERIELPTFGLQNHCSTAELNRRIEAIGGLRNTRLDCADLSSARIPDLPAKGQNP